MKDETAIAIRPPRAYNLEPGQWIALNTNEPMRAGDAYLFIYITYNKHLTQHYTAHPANLCSHAT